MNYVIVFFRRRHVCRELGTMSTFWLGKSGSGVGYVYAFVAENP